MKTQAYAALLRGINLGKRRVPMPELAKLFAKAGCTDVKTYVASGNVVFRATDAVAKKVVATVGAAIEKGYGFDAPMVLRTHDELQAVVDGNPFLKKKPEGKQLAVVFLEHSPTQAQLTALDLKRSAPDELVAHGQDLYLYLPNGGAKTLFTNAYFDKTLKTMSTARNWNTVLKMLEMTA